MKGFKSKGACYANGGMVRGPGTGTSDSVKDNVPPGTFIMPADSTEKIGAEQLAGMGFKAGKRPEAPQAPDVPLGFKPKSKREAEQPESAAQRGAGFGFSPKNVPVNLSNGEFRISPEQVHAIGAEVLEGLKDATHAEIGETPDQEAKEMEGEGDHVARDELFFADGGLVDTPKRDPFAYQAPGTAPASTQPSPIPGAERPAQPTFKPDASAPSPIKGPLDSMGTAFGETAKKLTFGGFDSRASDIQAQNRAGLTAEPEKPVTTPGQPQTTNPGLPGAFSASSTPAASPAPAAPVGAATSVPGVRRIDEPGKSPLFTNVGLDGSTSTSAAPQPAGLGFRPGMGSSNGVPQPSSSPGLGFGPTSGSGVGGPDVMGILQRESQIRAGMGALQDQINFNGGGYGFRKVGTDEAIRDMVVRGNSRDRAAALGFMGGRQDAADRYDLTRQDQALRQQDALARQGIAAGEIGLKREAQGFQSESQRRLQGLQQQYLDEADPAKKAEIERSIRLLGGQAAPKQPFQIAMSEEPLDPANPTAGTRKTPYVVDPATGVGRPVVQNAATIPASAAAALKSDPKRASEFDAKYGAGAAARVLANG